MKNQCRESFMWSRGPWCTWRKKERSYCLCIFAMHNQHGRRAHSVVQMKVVIASLFTQPISYSFGQQEGLITRQRRVVIIQSNQSSMPIFSSRSYLSYVSLITSHHIQDCVCKILWIRNTLSCLSPEMRGSPTSFQIGACGWVASWHPKEWIFSLV